MVSPSESDAPKRARRAKEKLQDAVVTPTFSAFAEPQSSMPAINMPMYNPMTSLLFQEPQVVVQKSPALNSSVNASSDEQTNTTDTNTSDDNSSRKRKRGGRGRHRGTDPDYDDEIDTVEESGEKSDKVFTQHTEDQQIELDIDEDFENTSDELRQEDGEEEEGTSSRRRRRRTRSERQVESTDSDVSVVKGSTRMAAKRLYRREGRINRRRKQSITESEFLARRENIDRLMIVREKDGLNQIAVLEDGILVEHYVARHTQISAVGNVYLGRVQNVLPSMEAAFVDIGKGRNAVLYAGEVNWDAAGLEGKTKRIEQAINVGDKVMVQVTKDPIGQKGARLTSQITLAGRHLVLVPGGEMTGISRKLPERERIRLKRIIRRIIPDEVGVIVRTAAEGATQEQLEQDVERLLRRWEDINTRAEKARQAPVLLKSEPELAIRVVRDQFNEDFNQLIISGDNAWQTISEYVAEVSPDLCSRLSHWTGKQDLFAKHRVDEQLAKGMDRKVWLPSGGSLVIDRTEAMTVIDVNTGRFVGEGGTLEETVTLNNLEAAEEIVRQIRIRDIGGIIVIDFIDMVLEANRELVIRRLLECLGRDRTRHQVAEVTSLGIIQMTRKRVGQGLVEAFSSTCEACEGRGFITHAHPVEKGEIPNETSFKTNGVKVNNSFSDTYKENERKENSESIAGKETKQPEESLLKVEQVARESIRSTLAAIAAAAEKAHSSNGVEAVEDTSKVGRNKSKAGRRRVVATTEDLAQTVQQKSAKGRKPKSKTDETQLVVDLFEVEQDIAQLQEQIEKKQKAVALDTEDIQKSDNLVQNKRRGSRRVTRRVVSTPQSESGTKSALTIMPVDTQAVDKTVETVSQSFEDTSSDTVADKAGDQAVQSLKKRGTRRSRRVVTTGTINL